MSRRFQAAPALARLDPVHDSEAMVRLIVSCEFPFDAQRAMELAFFRTFGIPQIARVLVGAGGFLKAPGARIAATAGLLTTLVEGGYRSETGQAILRRINHAHRGLAQNTDEMRYVLATFVFEPQRWVARFGWRPLTPAESMASFVFWRQVGAQMGIQVPDEQAAFAAFYEDFEARWMTPDPANHALAVRVRDHLLHAVPAPFRAMGRHAVHGLLDPRLRVACGLPIAPKWVSAALPRLLRLRGEGARRLLSGTAPVLQGPRRTVQGKKAVVSGVPLDNAATDR